MIYYNFDGIRLPKPVELNGYNYQLICSNKDELFFTHSLMISKAPFKVLNDKICFDSAVDYQFYTARNDSTSWKEGSLTIVENDKATTTLTSVIDSSEFLWTNEDIYRYNSDEIVYKKFEAEEDVVALKPEIKTNLSQDKYYRLDDENIETLKIITESPDGGELSYQWYKNGEKIEEANSNTYKPIITEIGKDTYYCEVTNNYQGDLASINSKTITITVAEALVPISEEFLLGWKIGRLVAMLRGQIEPSTLPSEAFLSFNQANVSAKGRVDLMGSNSEADFGESNIIINGSQTMIGVEGLSNFGKINITVEGV